MEEMKFSVVVPTLNQINYLQECIESVYAQTYKKPFQLVIVNDGSDDGRDGNGILESSLSQTRAYLDYNLPRAKHIKRTVVHNETNLGVAKAFNTGFYYCKGEWIAILDHDDKLLPECLEELEKFIEENDNERIGLIYTNLVTQDGKERRYPDFIPGRLQSCFEMGNLNLYRRQALEEVNGWRIGLEYSHDTACIVDMVECGWEIKHFDKIVYWNRLHSEQFTQRFVADGKNPNVWKQKIIDRTINLRPELWVESKESQKLQFTTQAWRREAETLYPYCRGLGVDIGCGHRKRYPLAIGVDKDRWHGKSPEIVCDVEKEELPFSDGTLDYIILCHVIEHFYNPLGIVRKLFKKLKRGGYMLCIVPDKRYVPPKEAKIYKKKHQWEFTPESFKKDFVENLTKEAELFRFDSIQNSWSFDAFFRKL